MIVVEGARWAGEQENGGCHVGFVAGTICWFSSGLEKKRKGGGEWNDWKFYVFIRNVFSVKRVGGETIELLGLKRRKGTYQQR